LRDELRRDQHEFGAVVFRVFNQSDPAVTDQAFQVVAHAHFRVLEQQKKLFQVDGLLVSVRFVEEHQDVIGDERRIHRKILLRKLPDLRNQVYEWKVIFQKMNYLINQ